MRLGALWDVQSADHFAVAEREAKARQLTLRTIKLENPPYDFEEVFHRLAQDGVDMLHVLSSPLFLPQSPRIGELAIAVYPLRVFVVAGVHVSLRLTSSICLDRGAFVDRILRA